MNAIFKKVALTAVMFVASVAGSYGMVPDETLHYSVRFKWGLIDANVGVATVTTRNLPGTDTFEATLSGKSVDLLGHYYVANDDITGTIMASPMSVTNNATLECEHGAFSIETVTYDAEGPSKNGPVVGHLDNGEVIRARQSDYASGLTVDMLSVFYYMRQIDYASCQPGSAFRINLANGNQVDHLHIIYIGPDDMEVGGAMQTCRHIALTFSVGGKSDSMEVWLADDAGQTPVYIKGALSVGHMECRLVDQQTIDSLKMSEK